jgi:hypothetical protein
MRLARKSQMVGEARLLMSQLTVSTRTDTQ